ncbi:MAG: hypothetical protein ACK5AZ_15560 [Bryobacteraceae bacterium]
MGPGSETRGVELTGLPGLLRFPLICAHCGHAASGRILIEKVFSTTHRDHLDHEIVGAAVPFCPRCAAQHEREVRRVTSWKRVLMCFRSAVMLGVLGAIFLGALFLPEALGRLTRADWTGAAIFGAIVLLFLLLAAGCFRVAWSETRRFAVPPQTSITRSFDFGANLTLAHRTRRHAYTLFNPRFAEAFLLYNRDRAWDPGAPGTRRTRPLREGLIFALIAAGAAWMIWDSLIQEDLPATNNVR